MELESVLNEEVIEANLKQFLLVLSVSLGVATLPKVFGWFRNIPYTLLLVIAGLGLAVLDVRLVNLSPSLILSIFLPPLLFEAAWNLKWQELKEHLAPICLYAVFGVVISIAGVTLGLNQFTSVSLATALLIGASLSATDPVSVIALFRELGVEKRLSVIMEGESLFNDGMAVVAFGFLVALNAGTVEPTVQALLFNLAQVVGVGIGVGGLFGFGISYLTQRFDLPLVEQSLTLVAAYAAYLITEDFGGSGVIGVVTTGLVLGNFGSRIGMNPRTRIIVTEFWEFLAFFVNSIVFLLIGDQVQFDSLLDNLGLIGVTIGSMVLARALGILVLSGLSNRVTEVNVPFPEQIVLWWGGLRGSVGIALALSVSTALPERQLVISTIFGVVLFTLLVQGLTIGPLLKKLKLLGDQPSRQRYTEVLARLTALKQVLEHLDSVDQRPGLDPEFCRYQTTLIKGEIENLETEIDQLQDEYPNLRDYVAEQLREELLTVEATAYAELVRSGQLSRELSPFLQLESEGS
ncbi:MAG: sodium:proton antiporter [Pegethrix bostrychoides GSE-TBD4-15B]|jgi:CPA1 family monovalent cation:H+ antiporter|uniref:Sodium:proton antiporter n=1 Tax=Pegethrix bostrychoides GSE-TBD4-15B TaxID=2839662 RepID=A0A951P8W6_9CYAN|nr:sodium:proton antiporter [Pegethrix bostrychoides GSE-TBD4-15B]